jgi:hypothetical protein
MLCCPLHPRILSGHQIEKGDVPSFTKADRVSTVPRVAAINVCSDGKIVGACVVGGMKSIYTKPQLRSGSSMCHRLARCPADLAWRFTRVPIHKSGRSPPKQGRPRIESSLSSHPLLENGFRDATHAKPFSDTS